MLDEVEKLKKEKNQYNSLKEQLSSMDKYYVDGINALVYAINDIGKYYTVDDDIKAHGKLKNQIDTLSNRVDYINDTIIPAINSKIVSLDKKIRELESSL